MLRLIQSRGLFVSTTVGGRHRLIHGLANRQPHGLRNGLVVKRKVELVNRAVTSKGIVFWLLLLLCCS